MEYDEDSESLDDWDDSMLDDVIAEYGGNVDVKFRDVLGIMNVYPHIDKIPTWENNIRVKRSTTIFVYTLTRGGIVDGDYRVTYFVERGGKLVKLTREEITRLLVKEMAREIKEGGEIEY